MSSVGLRTGEWLIHCRITTFFEFFLLTFRNCLSVCSRVQSLLLSLVGGRPVQYLHPFHAQLCLCDVCRIWLGIILLKRHVPGNYVDDVTSLDIWDKKLTSLFLPPLHPQDNNSELSFIAYSCDRQQVDGEEIFAECSIKCSGSRNLKFNTTIYLSDFHKGSDATTYHHTPWLLDFVLITILILFVFGWELTWILQNKSWKFISFDHNIHFHCGIVHPWGLRVQDLLLLLYKAFSLAH